MPSPEADPSPVHPTPGTPPDVSAVIVNYGTPDLTRAAAWSLRSLYPELPIAILDNGSPDDSLDHLRQLAHEAGGVDLVEASTNLHHGPGLDLLFRRATTAWVLAFDSDCIAYRRGFIEAMMATAARPEAYAVGQLQMVDADGFVGGPHRYVHAKCALVRRERYLALPPFARHGTPLLANLRAAAREGLTIEDFPVRDYVYHLGEGTSGRYGYGLGWAGRWARLRHLVRRRRA